jgi:glycosidase
MNAELLREFPTLTTFVEAWANTTVANAYYVRNNFDIPFKHNAQGAIDFSLCFACHAGMTQSPGWTDGVNRIYMTLAQDFIYKDPLKNCIFLDNHDMDRVFSTIGEDWNKMTWGLNWLMTLRGIPQIYYGTEILMKNFKNPTDAEVRLDFPGGWPGDPVDKFKSTGRNPLEEKAFQYTRSLARYRRSSSALTTGRTMQYVVRDGAYVYFRYDDRQTVMVVTNTGRNPFKPDWKAYSERTSRFTRARNVVTGEEYDLASLTVPPGAGWVMELK